MKKLTAIFLVILCIQIHSQAQTFQISVNCDNTIKEEFRSTGYVHLSGDFEIMAVDGNAHPIQISLNPASTITNSDFMILDKSHPVLAVNAVGDKFLFHVLLKNDKTSEPTQMAIIDFTDANTNSLLTQHIISVENATATSSYDANYDYDQEEFRIDLGSNFDFLDGLQGEGLYANVQTFHPKVLELNIRGKTLNIGSFSGIRRIRSFNDSTDVNSFERNYYQLLDGTSNNDTADYVVSTFNQTVQQDYNILSMHGSPLIELFSSDKNSKIFFGIHYNLERKRVSTSFNYNLLATDTLSLEILPRRESPGNNNQIDNTFYDHHFGMIVPFMFPIRDKLNVTFIPHFGRTWSELTPSMYYGVYFNVMERSSGINLGGQVSAYHDIHGKRNFSPLMNIYLTKAFDLGSLLTYKK